MTKRETTQPIGVDATGYTVLTRAVLELLESFPGLGDNEIRFEELGAKSGIAFSADAGALVMSERRSITDHVVQTCQYPFFVVYRTSSSREYQKLYVQDFMDTLGKWLCKEPAEINGETIRLSETGGRAQNHTYYAIQLIRIDADRRRRTRLAYAGYCRIHKRI